MSLLPFDVLRDPIPCDPGPFLCRFSGQVSEARLLQVLSIDRVAGAFRCRLCILVRHLIVFYPFVCRGPSHRDRVASLYYPLSQRDYRLCESLSWAASIRCRSTDRNRRARKNRTVRAHLVAVVHSVTSLAWCLRWRGEASLRHSTTAARTPPVLQS